MTPILHRPRWVAFLLVAMLATVTVTTGPDAAEPASAVQAPTSPINPDTLSPYPTPTGGVIGFTQSSISNQSWQVRDFTQVGDRVFVGGSFTQVVATPFAGAQTWDQPFLAAFDVNTGDYITTWTPELDDVVWALQSYNGLLYVGGEFDTVNGTPRQGLVALDPITGAIDPTFAAEVDNVETNFEAAVRDLHFEGDDLYVVGEFNRLVDAFFAHGRFSSARVDGTTGRVDDNWIPRPTGGGIFAVDSDPGRGRVILAGSFESVDASPDTDNGAVVSHVDGSLLLDPQGAVAYPMPLNSATSRGWYATVIDGDHHWYGGEEHIAISRDADTWAIEGCVFSGFGNTPGPNVCTESWQSRSGGGDYQVAELLAPNVLILGCHCRGNFYNSFEDDYVPELGYPEGGFRLYRSDGTAFDFGANIPTWGEGPYAGFADSAGCLWVGGDYSGNAQGFGRFCDMEDADGDGVDDFRDTVDTAGALLSRAGTATSSSVWDNNPALFGPANGIDGERLGWYAAHTIVHTNNESQPWWDLDLGTSAVIAGINLYNRTDGNREARLDNVEVLIGDQPFGDISLDAARAIAAYSVVIPTTGELRQLSIPDVTGRYVRLQLPGNQILNFAEVDVFESVDTDGDGLGDHRDTVRSAGAVVSTGAIATQSSDASPQATADKAVDGSLIGDPATTDFGAADDFPWWDVDLGANFSIDAINIFHPDGWGAGYNETIRILISDTPFQPGTPAESQAQAVWFTDLPITNTDLREVAVPDIEGQYVRLQQSANQQPLNLAEVQVMGTASNLPPFGTPANVTLATNGTDEVTVTWEPVANAKGYLVHRDFQFIGFVGPDVTELVDQGLSEGETYRYQVRAQALDDSYSPPSALQSITVFDQGNLPPFGTPANATLSTNGVDQVDVTWEGVADAKGYVIHRDFQFVAFVPFTETSWSDTTVVQNETYRYQVRAQAQDDSFSIPTPLQSITVFDEGALPPFGTPANVGLATNGVDQVSVAWEQVADAKGYVIHRDFQFVAFVPFTESSWIDTNVVVGETYRYQVRAQAQDNSFSAPSALQSITVFDQGNLAPFGTPANVTLATNDIDEVTITWEQVADAKGYVVHRDFQFLGFVSFTEASFVDDTVTFGNTYRYQVRAQAFDNTFSQPSAIQSIGVGEDVTPPSTPQNVTLTVEPDGTVTVDWDPATDDVGVDSYLIHREFVYRGFTNGATTDFNDDTVVAGTRYRYQVRARDDAGNISPPSDVVSITP